MDQLIIRIVLDVKGSFNTHYNDKRAFTVAANNYIKGIKENPISGQAMPALGTAVLVNAVNAMGADHTAGNSFGNPSVDATKKEGQVELSTNLQVGMATFDKKAGFTDEELAQAIPF